MDTQELNQNEQKHVATKAERRKALIADRPQAYWYQRTVWINEQAHEMNFETEKLTPVCQLFVEIEKVVKADCPDLPTNAQIAIVYHPDVTRFMDWGTIRFALDAQRMAVKVSKK